MAKDITNVVETPSDFQARARVKITSVYADASKMNDSYYVVINGEVMPTKGDTLDTSLTISAVLYDVRGRVIGKSDEQIDGDEFFRFEAFSMSLYVNSVPSRICLIPRTQSSSSSNITIQLD